MILRIAVVTAWLCLIPVSASAQDGETKSAGDLEPLAVLKKAAEAAKQIKTVRYAFKRQGLDADEDKSPKLSGTATLGGWAYKAVQKYRVEMKVQRPGTPEPTDVMAGSDGDIVYLIDAKAKKVYADLDPAVLGAQNAPVRVVLLSDFVDPEPFAEAMKAEKFESAGVVPVGGEDCYKIRTKPKSEGSEVIWFIAKKDFLPRRMDMIFPSRDGKPGGRTIELSNLTVNPKLDSDPFKLVVPDGFTKTDDFAP